MSGVGGFGHEKMGARLLGMQLLWEGRLQSLNEDASLCSLCIAAWYRSLARCLPLKVSTAAAKK